MMPDERSRLALLRDLLADHQSVIAEQMTTAVRTGIVSDPGDLEGLLRKNEDFFYRSTVQLGIFRAELASAWWTRVVAPMLDEMSLGELEL